jgi:CRP-like cAMP-binding protein
MPSFTSESGIAMNTARHRPGGRLPAAPVGQPDPEAMASRMRRFDLFTHLPAHAMRELTAAARIQAFHAGEYLWHQGEPNRQVLFIERGLAITSRRAREGVNRTYGLYGPGDSMGIHAIWAGMRYPTDARALGDGMTAIQLDTGALVQCAQREPRLAAPLLVEIGRFTESFIRKIDIVSAGTVPRRVAALMSMLVTRHGIATRENEARLPFRLTLEQIGAIVDSRIETVARVLGEWKRQGWLRIDADGFHFGQLDRLAALLAD